MDKFLKHFLYVPLAFLVLGILSSCGSGSSGSSSGGGSGSSLVFLPPPNTITGSFDTSDPSFNGNGGLSQIGVDNGYERGYFGQGTTIGVVNRGDSIVSGVRNAAAGIITTHIVAGNASNTSGSGLHTFTTNDFGVTAIASIIQVIAPSATITSFSFTNASDLLSVYTDAATSGIHILNNSWGSVITVSGTYDGNDISSDKVPLLQALFDIHDNGMVSLFSDIVATVGDANMVFVYAAGDQGWHEGGSVEVEFSINGSTKMVSQSDFIAGFSLNIGGGVDTAFRELNIDLNGPGGYAAAPLYEESLVGRWVHVVAVDSSDEISDFSNGCGNTSRYWCLAAPGVNISVDSTTTTVGMRSGTGVAAGYASGALALLRSRLPDMPMSVILALLFHTATDLGEVGIDALYGHGLIDLAQAITLQGNVSLVVPQAPSTSTIYMKTAEFLRNYGLAQIGAHHAYERGYFGQGVTVGVIDTGMLTSHLDLTANVVAGRKADSSGLLSDTTINNGDGRGTFVGGVIGSQINASLVHGVAPSASIMPLQFSDNNFLPLLGYGATTGVHILNNSWSGHLSVTTSLNFAGNVIEFILPIISPAMTLDNIFSEQLLMHRNIFSSIAATVGDEDIALVWAAGDGGWHEGGTVTYSLRSGSTGGYITDSQDDFIDRVHTYFGLPQGISLALNEPNPYGLAPLYEPSLIGRWAHAVAVDRNSVIAGFSNGCGNFSKYWCLAAPGEDITGLANDSDTAITVKSGTAYSAGHVSGALAVLKSRLPDMPMSVILALLFNTATDLGETGVDDIYGHGLVNLEQATTLQGNVSLVIPDFIYTLFVSSTVTATVAPPTIPTYAETAEFLQNYGLAQIGADEAYKLGYFGQGVTVGVVDTGVRTTHIDLTANLIPGRRANSSGELYTDINDADGRGTYAAGIIGAEINNTLVYGVAPLASIMPLQFGNTSDGGLDGDPLALFGYAVANSVHILNNSWGAALVTVTGGYTRGLVREDGVTLYVPFAPGRLTVVAKIPYFNSLLPHYDGVLTNQFSQIAATAGSSDMVFVWAAGDYYWKEGSRVLISIVADNSASGAFAGTNLNVHQEDFIGGFRQYHNGQTIFYNTLGVVLDRNDPGGYALAPLYEPDLLGRWVHVVAVDSVNVIADFSNGCGNATKYWCLAAPGVNISSTSRSSDSDTGASGGTFAAAPHVSGALAVLKSRLPNMPMSVILALLFTTATDLGEVGLDDIYGHGLVNLERAITLQGIANLVVPTPPAATPYTPPAVYNNGILSLAVPNAAVGTFGVGVEYNRSPWLAQIGAGEAYKRKYFGQGVTVGVVDSGVFTNHVEIHAKLFNGRRADSAGNLYTVINDADGRGTFVAGVIGAEIDGGLHQGVAPLASIMPLQFGNTTDGGLDGDLLALFNYAAANNVHILNNSWTARENLITGFINSRVLNVGLDTIVIGGITVDLNVEFESIARVPLLRPLFAYEENSGSYIDMFSAINAATESNDMVFVWAAGDDSWHEGGSIIITVVNSSPLGQYDDIYTLSQSDFMGDFFQELSAGRVSLNTLNIDFNDPGGYALAPIYETNLLGRWVHVAAVDSANNIADFSNACGEVTKNWCLVAPGVNVTSITNIPNIVPSHPSYAVTVRSGTDVAAAHISGALAVLRSRLPNMPMSVILALLFETATDLGDAGVDSLYGHGLVNLDAATSLQGSVDLVVPTLQAGVNPIYPPATYDNGVLMLNPPNYATAYVETAEFLQNYGLAQIGADEAYKRGYFGQGVTVGVVDTGVRTTHDDLTANLVSGRRADSFGNLYTDINDADGHGTFIAGVIGAAMNNSLIHGVAPSASIMPLQFGNTDDGGGLDGGALALFAYAATSGVHILNNSWSITRTVSGNYNGNSASAEIPLLRHLFGYHDISSVINMFSAITATVKDADMAFVWSSGNDYWHEGGSVVAQIGGVATTLSQADFISGFSEDYFGYNFVYNTLNIDTNDPGGYALAPIYEQSLLGRWVHVAAVDNANIIADFSNGCGTDTQYWCLSAPGVNINGIGNDSDTATAVRSDTAVAAAHVSGALAVLKSRLPNMPMSVILALLFETATDLGDAGVDALYGHGLVNLERAITLQGSINLVIPTIPAGVTAIYPAVSLTASYNNGTLILPPPNIANNIDYQTTEFLNNYGLAQIGADEAYKRGYFGQGVTVGVVDTGVHVTHIDLTANLVPGRRADSSGNLHTDINDADGHGTFVAGVIGAAMDNFIVHGVAPSASVMPLQFGNTTDGDLDGNPLALFNYAATSSVHILNNSWGVANTVTGIYNGSTLSANLPLLRPLFEYYNGGLINNFSVIIATINSADMAFVWAAGNSYWHEGGSIFARVSGAVTVLAQNDFIAGFTQSVFSQSIVYNTLSIDLNDPGGYALAPIYEPSLLGRWVHVIAVDSNSAIADFSNGCGNATKYWCLAAPGVNIFGLSPTGDSGTATRSGTSFSAPHVSGALAVLKSRLPNMPMSVVLALLFETATDLGATGVDALYGHGLVNLERAVTLQGNISLVVPVLTSNASALARASTGSSNSLLISNGFGVASAAGDQLLSAASASNNLLMQSNIKVSPLLSALKEQLSEVSVAAEFLPGYYYNTPLGGLIEVSETDSNLLSLNEAASDMLLETKSQDLGYGFAVLQSEGTILQVSHETAFWHLDYDICASCETSLWESYQATDIAAPFFAHNRQGMSFAAKLGERLELFAAAGLDDDDASETNYEQYGFRWRYDSASTDSTSLLEFSRTNEEGSLYGGEYNGAFALSGSDTYQGRLHTEKSLTDGWRGMADYQFGWTDSEVQSGGLITDISRLRFDGYRIGAEGNSLFGVPFSGDGLMRLGVTRQSGIRSGTIGLRYGVATTSEFIEDYQYSLNNGYEIVEREFSLATKPTTIYHWGYTFAPHDNMRAAFGLEYNANANDSAASLALNWAY